METNDKEEIVEQSSHRTTPRQSNIPHLLSRSNIHEGMESGYEEKKQEQSPSSRSSKFILVDEDASDMSEFGYQNPFQGTHKQYKPKPSSDDAQTAHLNYLNKSSFSEGARKNPSQKKPQPQKPVETNENRPLLTAHRDYSRDSSKFPSAFNRSDSLTSEELQQATDNLPPITRLLWHHIREKDYPVFGIRDGFIIAGSAAIAGASLILYWLPTLSFAADNSDLFGPALTTIVLESGVNIANFNLSALATSETLSEYFGRKLPDHVLKAINEKSSKKVLTVVRLGGFAVLSLVAALPFGVSVEGSLYEKIIVELTTAFINNYGLNNLALGHFRTVKQKLTRSEQKKAIYMLKKHMTYTMDRAVREIIKSKEIPLFLTPKTPLGPHDLIQDFAALIRDLKLHPKQDLTWGQFILRRLIPGLIGAHIPLVGMTGYNFNLYDIMAKWIPDNRLAIPLSVLFASVFQYIAMTAAAITFMDAFELLTCKSEKSLARQLYATRTLLANGVMFISAVFSFGTSEYFIASNHYFNGNGFLAPYKLLFLIYGILSPDVFNFFGGINFVKNVAEKCAEFWGDKIKKPKAHFALEMREFLNNLNNVMSDLKFLEGLEALSPEDRKTLVNLPYHLNVDDIIKIAKGESFGEDSYHSEQMIDLSNILNNKESLSTWEKYQEIPEDRRNEIKQELNERAIDLKGAVNKIKSYGTTPSLGKLSKFWSSKPKPEKDSEKQAILTPEKSEDEQPSKFSLKKSCNII